MAYNIKAIYNEGEMKLISEIEKLIAAGDIEQAIKRILEVTSRYDTKIKDSIILLSAQYQRWKNQNLLGISESEVPLRNIEASVLALSKKLDDQVGTLHEKERIEYEIVIEAKFDINDQDKIQQVINSLIFCSQDYSIKTKKIKSGSIIIRLEGTKAGYKKLKTLFEERDLEDIIGLDIIDLYEKNGKSKKKSSLVSTPKAKIVAKEYLDSFTLGSLGVIASIPIPGASISITSSEAVLLSKIAGIYGLKTSGTVWRKILKVFLSKHGSQSILKLYGEYLGFPPIVGFALAAPSFSFYNKGFGEVVISFFEEKLPNQGANTKPKLNDLKKAFGKDIHDSELLEYLDSY